MLAADVGGGRYRQTDEQPDVPCLHNQKEGSWVVSGTKMGVTSIKADFCNFRGYTTFYCYETT